jgi:hypothetical protein
MAESESSIAAQWRALEMRLWRSRWATEETAHRWGIPTEAVQPQVGSDATRRADVVWRTGQGSPGGGRYGRW